MSESESADSTFHHFFVELCDGKDPRRWQCEVLSAPPACGNRLIRVPTGFGKTLGVLAAWIWHRVRLRNEDWPRRLVWCLPIRVLVEQTESEVRSALQRLRLLWDGEGAHDGKVGVHLIMGGADAGRWHLYPETDAVLIGTQDMLLSRAMNRGYASPRARWPMEFGLLNQDALWVMDEVQLMDAGLATSGQLQVFRNEDRSANKTLRPCFTWWMSATLQRDWLEKSPDTAGLTGELAGNTHRIEPEDRSGDLWDDVAKPLEVVPFGNSKALARDVSQRHRDRGCGKEGVTLVVLNTVKCAVEVWKALRADKALKATDADVRLTHSRFRPPERKSWGDAFLNRPACAPGTNRIIVSTQVIEAGVDISASLLVTELAPWTSLVQRFGRCARWGGSGQMIVADFGHDNDRKAAPYSKDALNAARDACGALPDVAPLHLERFEEENEALLPRLYPYEPRHLLLRHELNDLFDTSPDLSGADVDISRFIRSGNERDVQVFWAEVGGDPSPNIKPTRDELCSVPFLEARDWLCKPKSEGLKPDIRAWVWDWPDRGWRGALRRDIHPGQTVLVECSVGGYRRNQGWDRDSRDPVEPVQVDGAAYYESRRCWTRDGNGWRPGTRHVRALPPEDHADAAEDDESLSVTGGWQTIATHGLRVGEAAERIAAASPRTRPSSCIWPGAGTISARRTPRSRAPFRPTAAPHGTTSPRRRTSLGRAAPATCTASIPATSGAASATSWRARLACSGCSNATNRSIRRCSAHGASGSTRWGKPTRPAIPRPARAQPSPRQSNRRSSTSPPTSSICSRTSSAPITARCEWLGIRAPPTRRRATTGRASGAAGRS